MKLLKLVCIAILLTASIAYAKRFTEFPSQTDPLEDDDIVLGVDTSDVTDHATGSSKQVNWAQVSSYLANVYQELNVHLTDLADGSLTGAKVGLDTTNFDGNLSAADANLQQALETLDELQAALNASQVPFTPNGNIAATNVQAAIVEVRDDAASLFQPLDPDLTTAAGAGAAGLSKYFGTNSSGTAGFFDVPTELTDLSNVQSATPTNRHVLVGSGTSWGNRLLYEADIADLGTYQDADADLTTAAGANSAGNSKYFGTNATGTVGFFDVGSGGSMTWPSGTGIPTVVSGSSWGTTYTLATLAGALDDEDWTFTGTIDMTAVDLEVNSVSVVPSSTPSIDLLHSSLAGTDKYAGGISADARVVTDGNETTDISLNYMKNGTATAAMTVDGVTDIAEFNIPVVAPVYVLSKSADYTLGADEAKSVLVIATGAVDLTLPGASLGKHVCLMSGQGVTSSLGLIPATGDYLVKTGVRGTAATARNSAGAAGDMICVVAGSASDWYITSEVGTWAE